MILPVFLVLLGLTLALIALGLSFREEHLELAIVGFLFLFFLSFFLLHNGLQYKTGVSTATTFTYNGSTLMSQTETATDVYTTYNDAGVTLMSGVKIGSAHQFGFWLMMTSLAGLAFTIFYMRVRRPEDD